MKVSGRSRPGGVAPTSDGLQESRPRRGCNSANTGGQLAARMERAGRTATLGKPGGVGTSWPERFRAKREKRIYAGPQGRPLPPYRVAKRGSRCGGLWGVAGTPAEGVVEDRLPG